MDTKKHTLLDSRLLTSFSTTASNNYPVFTPDLTEQNSSTLDILYKTALEGITDTLELSDKENSPNISVKNSITIPNQNDQNQTQYFDVNSSQETYIIPSKSNLQQESTLKLAIKSLEQELSYYKFENEVLNKELALERAKLAKETENLLLEKQENNRLVKMLDESNKKLEEYKVGEQIISTPVCTFDKKVKFNAVDLTPEIINKNFPVNTPVKKGRRLIHEQTPGPAKGLLKKSCLNAQLNNNEKYKFDKNESICLSDQLKENSYVEIDENTYEEIDGVKEEVVRGKWNKNSGDSLTVEMEEANEAIKILKQKLNQKSPTKISPTQTPENTQLKQSIAANPSTQNQQIIDSLSKTASNFTTFMNNLTPSTDDNLYKRNKIKPNLLNSQDSHIKKLQFSLDQIDSDVDKSTFREGIIKSPKIENFKKDLNFEPKTDFNLKIDKNFESNLKIPTPEPESEDSNSKDRLKRISIANQSSMEKVRLEKVKQNFIKKLDKKRQDNQYVTLPKSSSHQFEKPKQFDILKSKTCQNLKCFDSPEVFNVNGRKSKFLGNEILESNSTVSEKCRPVTVGSDRVRKNSGRRVKCIKQSSSTMSLKQEMVEARRMKGRKILNEEKVRLENTLNPTTKVIKSLSTSKLTKNKYNSQKISHTSHDNKQQIILAVEITCLPGAVNAKERKQMIEPIHSLVNDVEYHLVVLFRNERFQFRGVYRLDQHHKDDGEEGLAKSGSNLSIDLLGSVSSESQSITFIKVSGKGPDKITESNIKAYYSYYTGRKIFSPINGKTFGFNVAGMTIDESFWKKKTFKKKIKNEV